MAVTVLTPASTFRLTTLEAVLAEITLGDEILFAESLIDQVSASIARYCGCILAQQRYRETITMDGHGPISPSAIARASDPWSRWPGSVMMRNP